MRPNVTGLLLGLLLACLALVLVNTIRVMQRQNRVAAVLETAEARRWSETLALSDGWVGADVEGQMVARARCDALMALERPPPSMMAPASPTMAIGLPGSPERGAKVP